MKRKTEVVGNTVLDKMNYTDGSLVSKWNRAFPKRVKARKAERKEPVPKIVPETAKEKKEVGPTLKLIKETPVVFRLERCGNNSDFQNMAFAIKACVKVPDPQRRFAHLIHVDELKTGSRIIGCDGRRLHISEVSMKIKTGNYKPIMTKDVISLVLPDE